MQNDNKIEVWGYKTFRPFRIYWALYEYNLDFISIKLVQGQEKLKLANILKLI